MRSLAVLIAALCLVIAAPVMAVEDWRMLQEDSFEPSMAPLVEDTSFVPTLTGAPSLVEAADWRVPRQQLNLQVDRSRLPPQLQGLPPCAPLLESFKSHQLLHWAFFVSTE